MQSKAKTVSAYIKSLPKDRRKAIQTVRKIILKRIAKGFQETMQYGMISYVIPLNNYPNTYNGQPLAIVSLASQKHFMAVYLMYLYCNKKILQQFIEDYQATGKRLDMGKCCVRFKKIEDLPLNLIGKTISRTNVKSFIRAYRTPRITS